jgi:hypothetical protein
MTNNTQHRKLNRQEQHEPNQQEENSGEFGGSGMESSSCSSSGTNLVFWSFPDEVHTIIGNGPY